MSELLKNDKAMVILAVMVLVLAYTIFGALKFNALDGSIITSALTGLFGVAVGRTMNRASDAPNGGEKK